MKHRACGAVLALYLFAALSACGHKIDLPASTPVNDELGPPPETFTLDNGLEVVVIPDHRAPVVTHMLWYRAGAADEPEGKSGIAHFLEHLMFKGTQKIEPGEFSKIIARNGGRDNAFTSTEYTGYFQQVALEKLPLVMSMEADRMVNLVLSEKLVLPERDVVLEERRSRIENDPVGRLAEKMDTVLFPDHPYGVPLIGWPDEISRLTLADALAFYGRFYTPNNAILIVAGDITAEQLRPLAEETYGKIAPRTTVPPRTRPRISPRQAQERIVMTDEQTRQPVLRKLYLAPSYSNSEGLVAESLSVLAEILGGGPTSRLYRELIVEQKLAAQAAAWYSGAAIGQGSFGFSLVPRPGVDPAKLEEAFETVLQEFLAGGATDTEVTRAKSNLLAQAIYARDSQGNMARIYGVSLTTGETVEDVVAWPKRMRALQTKDVTAAANFIFQTQGGVTGLLLPVSSSAAQGRKLPAGKERTP